MVVETLNIQTGESVKTVKELRKELKDLKDQLLNTQQGTEEYKKTMVEAANIQHELKEQMAEINNSAMDFGQKLGNVTKTMSGVTGAITACTGVLSVFGVENEEAQKKLQETTKALFAVTEGMAKIDEGVKAFKRLKIAVDLGSGAMGKFKLALIGTGLGAFIVILGSIIAYWDDFTEAVGISSEQLNHLGDVAMGVINVIKEGMRQIAKSMGKLIAGDFAGAWEELKKSINVTEHFHQGVANSARKRAEERTKKEQEEAEKRRKAAEAEAKAKAKLDKQAAADAKRAAEEAKRQREEAARAATQAYKEQVEAAAKAAKYERDLAAAKVRGDNDKYTQEAYDREMKYYNTLLELYKYDAEKYDETILQKEQYLQDWENHFLQVEETERKERLKTISTFEDSIKTEQQKLEERYQMYLDAYEKEGKDTTELQKWYAEKKKDIEFGDSQKIIDEFNESILTEQEQLDVKYQMYVDAANKLGEDTTKIERWYQEEQSKLLEEQLEKRRQLMEYNIQSMATIGNSIGDILGSMSDMMEEGSKEQKGMAIASATINMLTGIGQALSMTYTTHSGIWDWALGIAQAATIAASGIAQIKKINEVKTDGSSQSTASASLPPVNLGSVVGNAPDFSQSMDGAMTQSKIEDQKVYVTEHDISSTQKKVDVIESGAKY